MRYGISTHLYHRTRLTRAHLEDIASFGFEAVEVFATRSHVDYHDPAALDAVAGWFSELGLRLHGIHGPIMEGYGAGDRWEGKKFSIAAPDQAQRQEAVRETILALELARRVPAEVLVLHLGYPRGVQSALPANAHDAALRSLEEIHAAARPLGLRLAIEVIPNELSTPDALVRLLEDDLPVAEAGICLDFGHAFLLGDVVDAVEQISGHLISTHVHDNDQRTDSHLAPFEGRIDWASALIAVQKVGYEGTLLLELADTSTPREVLDKARKVRGRFDGMLI
ncbi:MAG TPA: sugar phosphate isomerase/epimerase family protein [Vicinamibacterales bacterium]|nr:sugar phosphate isomerase/epimerase family protein [Vicinamibacterales bacterium]